MRLTAIALCTLLAGCATGGTWWRPGATEQEFHAERYQCMTGAHASIPPSMMNVGGYQGPAQVNCSTYGNMTNCTSSPGVNVAPVAIDANSNIRAEAFRACMQGKGWIWRPNQ